MIQIESPMVEEWKKASKETMEKEENKSCSPENEKHVGDISSSLFIRRR